MHEQAAMKGMQNSWDKPDLQCRWEATMWNGVERDRFLGAYTMAQQADEDDHISF